MHILRLVAAAVVLFHDAGFCAGYAKWRITKQHTARMRGHSVCYLYVRKGVHCWMQRERVF